MNEAIQIAILATGDEIVFGDVLNTNTSALAEMLHSEGFPPRTHHACCDDTKQIEEAIAYLAKEHQILLIIGGLGPTSDDKTRFALANFLQKPLVEYEEALEHVKERLKGTNRILNEANKQQTLFPPESVLLPNPNGSAMGAYYQKAQQLFILLPGPPRECLPMFQNYVLPLFKKFHAEGEQQLKWRLFAVSEGQIAPLLDEKLKDLDCQTGFRVDPPYVEFKVRCQKDLIETVKKRIQPLVEPHILTENNEKASEVLKEYLNHQPIKISIIDEASGGLLQTLIQTPENHYHVFFHESPAEIYIRIEGLKDYWFNTQEKAFSEVSISLKAGEEVVEERKSLPFYKALSRVFAAEWACAWIYDFLRRR